MTHSAHATKAKTINREQRSLGEVWVKQRG
jgi:hypothetical protein